MIRKFISWLRELFNMDNKMPWIHIRDGLYFAKELDGYSISKLDENEKTVFNIKLNEQEKDSVVDFLNK